jgi:DNA-binding NarL/FixJ family response regulator
MRVVVFDDILYSRQQDYAGMGVEFSFHEHADDAVGVVASVRPDLVLMDYAMEDHVTGEEAIQALRTRWPRGELVIIGISSDAHSNERMIAAGADDAVPKTHLRGYLRRVLRRGEAQGRQGVGGSGRR